MELPTYLNVLVSFFLSEGTAISKEIDEANGNATIDVQDELARQIG